MKSFTIAFFLLSMGGFAASQISSSGAEAAGMEAQRDFIAAERNRLEAGFLSEDAACYKKFAVNNCLDNVNDRRSASLADLRRQEIVLNDAQRKSKAEQQVRKSQEKLSPESLQQENARRTQAIEDFRGRQGRVEQNVQRRKDAVENEGAAHNANAVRLENYQKKIQAKAEKQASASEEANKFRERQVQSQKSRAQHKADHANRVKPASKPLPLPQ